jgi:hypothetical protein
LPRTTASRSNDSLIPVVSKGFQQKRLLRRLLGALSFSGNVGKHLLERCASGRIGVFR